MWWQTSQTCHILFQLHHTGIKTCCHAVSLFTSLISIAPYRN
ncbi:hypothetical protein HMPREF1553_01441 [Porphyromonas gingivalis F0568]|nr:hypothetical protein HMPREF1553_01441 [Porphyromonas gingivalis F0568]